jgi:hypothetical protein
VVKLKKKRTGERSCVYCGSTTQITREHVFPKNLFPSPRPKDLVTVPACETCNTSYGQDDEYFRAFAVTPAFEEATGRKMWDEKVFGSTLRRSPKLKKTLVDSLRKVEIKSPGGIYLGERHAVTFSRLRVDRIIEKSVRGLYRHHLGRRLRTNSAFDIWFNPKLESLREAGILEVLTAVPLIRIGDGEVVQYRFAYVPESPEHSIWWLRFYKTTHVVVLVNAGEPEASPQEEI